ncbi:nickel insertion protein [Apilactobacillus xinyiensis]|uniref:nickel insertion protein n=1 Tax=Apilactobacillus xinyiensis TaxID=2841032 RepID=UPI0031FE6130
MDDQSAERLAAILPVLINAGAYDVYFTPIQMKKNRPATKLSVLINKRDLEDITYLIFKHTSTVGIRYQSFNRTVMSRHFTKVTTPWGAVSVKVATFKDITKQTPEFEDCLAISQKYNLPIDNVYQMVYQQLKN